MNDVHSLSHTKWNCKYHIVFAPKYRRKVFEVEYYPLDKNNLNNISKLYDDLKNNINNKKEKLKYKYDL